MKIMEWNLNHRTIVKPIPDGVAQTIQHLAPDVVVLTEYVDREVRSAFRGALASLAFPFVSVSDARARHNQVLIASRQKHSRSAIRSPQESHASTNFLAVDFSDLGLTLIGIRVPTHKGAELLAYERELSAILHEVANRKVLLIGDLNGDPESPKSRGGRMLRGFLGHGWKIPRAEGDWSFLSNKGNSRIDHVIASEAIGEISARYLVEVNGMMVAGPGKEALSDHAILMCDVGVCAV